jgi:hypothetical protein
MDIAPTMHPVSPGRSSQGTVISVTSGRKPSDAGGKSVDTKASTMDVEMRAYGMVDFEKCATLTDEDFEEMDARARIRRSGHFGSQRACTFAKSTIPSGRKSSKSRNDGSN